MKDSKARLEQAKRDRELGIEAADAEIKRIEDEIKAAEVTYSIGDVFRRGTQRYMLMKMMYHSRVALFSVSSGKQVYNSIEVDSEFNIDPEELDNITNSLGLVRIHKSKDFS